MSLDIRGASGWLWEITRLGRGKILSLSQSPMAQNALVDARTWTASGTQTPTGAGDYFFYIRNDDTSGRNIAIARLAIDSAGADEVELRGVTGTPANGTTLTPLNRTRSSGKVPTATIENGVDITGLTSVGAFERLVITADTSHELNLIDRPIVLQQNQALALAAITGTVALNFRVDFWVDLSDPQVVT